jgi:hypothetical protein
LVDSFGEELDEVEALLDVEAAADLLQDVVGGKTDLLGEELPLLRLLRIRRGRLGPDVLAKFPKNIKDSEINTFLLFRTLTTE